MDGNQVVTDEIGKIVPFISKENIFSEHYLLNVLPNQPDWKDTITFSKDLLILLKSLLDRKEVYQSLTELDLCREFFDKIFKKLGHSSHIQVRTRSGDYPDYVFFENDDVKKNAETYLPDNRDQFYQSSVAIGEVKAWEIPLDGGKKLKRNILDPSHPTGQLYGYLLRERMRWGILSNGRIWRLYYYDGSWPRVGRYYEVDIIDLVENDDPELLNYFSYFFKNESFIEDSTNRNQLDRVHEESIAYAQELADDLREAVFEALRIIANGFLKWPNNDLNGNNPSHIKKIHTNSMLFLYRLLFILKAEAVGLLPLNNPIYRSQRSLDRIKREIRSKLISVSQPLLNDSDDIYQSLKRLFVLIDQGSAIYNNDDPLQIPSYNGGLFRQYINGTNELNFLSKKSIGDKDLGKAIDLLAQRTGKDIHSETKGFVDYSSLEIQQLGTLYEGLLEYQLGYASDDDYYAIGDNEKWVSQSEITTTLPTDLSKKAPKGTIFLQTDKGERHSTGSYYTPDFIVRYIIQQSIEPVLRNKISIARENKGSERDAILSLKILDPAMGSGHFLVDIIDYLTPELIQAIDNDKKNGILPWEYELSIDEAQREIAAYCIYGVDLNPMAVELAKVSLWMHTLSVGKPLTFLDHHLKYGNSLIGTNIRRLSRYPDEETRKRWKDEISTSRKGRKEDRLKIIETFPPLFLERITGKIERIDALTNDSVNDIKEKERIYRELKELSEYKKIISIANAWTAAYFGVSTAKTDKKKAKKNYTDLLWSVHNTKSETEWNRQSNIANLELINSVSLERGFFHWELEFPEIFFSEGELKQDAGFDVIVGNPPYINVNTLYNVNPEIPNIYNQLFEAAGEGRYDIYVLFVEQGLRLLNNTGELGYILPNKWFKGDFGRPLRDIICRENRIRGIVDWGGYYTIFRMGDKGPITFVALLFLSSKQASNFRYISFPNLTVADDRNVAKERLATSLRLRKSYSHEIVVDNLSSNDLNDEPWDFSVGGAKELLYKLQHYPRLHSFANVFTGAQTSAQSIYVLESVRRGPSEDLCYGYSRFIKQEILVEKDSIKMIYKGKDISRYRILTDDSAIIFPYQIVFDEDGKCIDVELYSIEEMSTRFPHTWHYLNNDNVKEFLVNREPKKTVDKSTGEIVKTGKYENSNRWYEYTYPRAMTRFWYPKLVFPDAASEGTVAYDSEGRVLVQSVYALEMKENVNLSIFFIQALLNSDIFTFFIHRTSNRLKDGFYRFQTKYVEPFPIPEIIFNLSTKEREKIIINKFSEYDIKNIGTHSDSIREWIDGLVELNQFDIVHDIIAYFVRKVNSNNREVLSEIISFLDWIECTFLPHGTRISLLSGKTKLFDYSSLTVDEFIDVFKKNKKHMTVDPNRREFFSDMKEAFVTSSAKLNSLLSNSEQIYPLIEYAVLKIYNITDEELDTIQYEVDLIQYH